MPDIKQEQTIKDTFHSARDNVQQQEAEQQQERKLSPEQKLRPTGPTLGPMANAVDFAVEQSRRMEDYLDSVEKQLKKERKPTQHHEFEEDRKKQVGLKKDFGKNR